MVYIIIAPSTIGGCVDISFNRSAWSNASFRRRPAAIAPATIVCMGPQRSCIVFYEQQVQ